MKKADDKKKSKPLLFIQQPNFKGSKLEMQNQYYFKFEELNEVKVKDDNLSKSPLEMDTHNEPEDEVINKVDQEQKNTELNQVVTEGKTDDNENSQMNQVKNDKQEELVVSGDELKQLKDTIMRLALYPRVVKLPFCEADVNGKKIEFQVIGKRNDNVRIKTRQGKLETIPIMALNNFSIIKGKSY
jgi:hypothetical protein